MSFRDVERAWSYNIFTKYAENNKPYRDSPKDRPRYPLGARRYSNRFYEPVGMSKESIPTDWIHSKAPVALYYGERNKLGIYHPDDTFEFVSDLGYGQGEALLVSAVLPGYLYCDSQCGGYLFKHMKTGYIVPVFEGLRIRVCDGLPLQNYEIHVNVLDKKKTKAFRERHEKMFKTGLAVLKAMGSEAIMNELSAMVDGQVSPAINYVHKNVHESYDPLDPGGSLLWLNLRYNINDVQYHAKYKHVNTWGWENFRRVTIPETIVRNVKARFYDELYHNAIEKGDEICKSKVVKFGDTLPTVKWGYKIFLTDTGEVRKQFK